jgi:hypothetical protein
MVKPQASSELRGGSQDGVPIGRACEQMVTHPQSGLRGPESRFAGGRMTDGVLSTEMVDLQIGPESAKGKWMRAPAGCRRLQPACPLGAQGATQIQLLPLTFEGSLPSFFEVKVNHG